MSEEAYRLFPFLSGVGTVALMGCLGARFGRRAALLSATLGGASFVHASFSQRIDQEES